MPIGMGLAGGRLGYGLAQSAGAAAVPAAWWYVAGKTAIGAYLFKGAASLTVARVNLVTPGTYDLTDGVAPTFATATGATFNGLTQYLKTGIVPGSGWSAVIRFSDRLLGGDAFSIYKSGNQRFAIEPYTGANQVRYQNGSFLSVTPLATSGVLAIAGQQGYRNGVADGGAIGGWGAALAAGDDIYLGARHRADISGVDAYCSITVQAFAVYSDTLDAAQNAALYTAIMAL